MGDRASRTRARSVVFLNRFYWPDIAATGQMLTDLAEGLAALNWDVTVITSNTSYDASRGSAALPWRERRNGVQIVRTPCTRFGRGALLGRFVDYATYLGGAAAMLAAGKRPSVIVAMSDPPMLAALAWLMGKVRRARSVYWVQDLFPDLLARLQLLSDETPLYRGLRAFARFVHRRCDLVVALGPTMVDALIAAGAPPERTTYVHNWADADAVVPMSADENAFLAEHGLRGKFVVLYSGNAGRAHTFDAVLDAARALRDDDNVVFVFVGGGPRTAELKRAVARDGLQNVRFFPYVDRARLGEVLSAATVSLVTENPAVEGLLVPSKTYGILASGRPIVLLGPAGSDVARVVRDTESGVVLPPESGRALTEWLIAAKRDPSLIDRLGRNARLAAEQTFNKRSSIAQWAALMETTSPRSGALNMVRQQASAP